MSTIIPKSQMTEEDIKLNFITPALVSSGWQNKITMETKDQFTDGKVNIRGNLVSREPAKKADYILYRIVIGDDGSVWYTEDHYETFKRIE